jgi:drug/metabolite transporter (DMT)-like permease
LAAAGRDLMLWIPITIWAAFAQTDRNAAQRHLTAELGTLGTLGLVELIFSYAVSRRIFRERIERRELSGISLLALGVIITLR